MNPKIAQRNHDGILCQVMELYAIARNKICLPDGFESLMYKFVRPNGKFILHTAHSLRRTPDLIHIEVDWINFLAAGGVTIA